jgi:ribosomal protein S12 methylthiotransferase
MKFALISLGCSKNLVDSENYIGILVNKKQLTITDNVTEADLVIVNTCGFIESAKKESIETILEIAEHKKSGQVKKLIVTGCFAQRYKDDILKEIEEVDAVIGTGEVDKIADVVDDILSDKKVFNCESTGFLPDSNTDRILTTPSHIAYIKIAEGCNRKCTYCIIPTLRGELKSRKIEDVVNEATKLAENGIKELNILAQESTEYGHDLYGKPSLAKLLKELVKINGIQWIRIHYIYPGSFDDELLELMKNEEKICNYFDIPIQHVSSRLLQMMGRQTTGEYLKNLLNKIRKEVPNATIRTSIIVGFPGETEEEFNELKKFIKAFKFDYSGIFKYSREEDTVAYNMKNQISEEIKEERWVELINLQRKIAEKNNKKYIGKKVSVIIDGISSESEYLLEGRMENQAYDIDGRVLINDGTAKTGDVVTVLLEQNFDYDFIGSII